MRVVFAASEMAPFAKTGGLADVIGSLTGEIYALGHEVSVFIPRYRNIDTHKLGVKTVVEQIEIPLGAESEKAKILLYQMANGVRVYLVEHPEFFTREGFYGDSQGDYADNDRRFIFFQRAVLDGLKAMNLKPDVIHCHDWQTALIPVYLKTLYAGESFFLKIKSVFTIHNLGYQGNFPPDSVPTTGLGWDQYRMDRLEFYGKISFIKGGLIDADIVTTVSERYSQEIQTKEFGAGMEGVLAKRKDHVFGIVNGIDLEEWNPESDKDLPAAFTAKKIEKKYLNKAELQREDHLKVDPKAPLIGMVTRLVDQKGIDILLPALSTMMEMGMQFVLLGTGEERYHHILREFAKKNKGRASVHILFDMRMAKLIYAGCDMLLVPSYYEPCGLGQMIALRFGTIPVVRATGGLADTVRDFDIKTSEGNGFVFKDYTTEALTEAVKRAVETYKNEKKWAELVQNAMACDFSWGASAKKYVSLYESTSKKASKSSEKNK